MSHKIKTAWPRRMLMAHIDKMYPQLDVHTTEELGWNKGGILVSAEHEETPFHYWHHAIDKPMEDLLDKSGWFAEYHDPGTVMIWRI